MSQHQLFHRYLRSKYHLIGCAISMMYNQKCICLKSNMKFLTLTWMGIINLSENIFIVKKCVFPHILFKKWTNTLHKKWISSLRISLVNLTKSAVFCIFGHIYWRNLYWKTLLIGQWRQCLEMIETFMT